MSPESVKLSHRNLPLLLLQAREQVIARFRPMLNAHGITEQQWRIVRALIDTGPLEPREIGELCRISSPSLAGVLSRMEELRYIKRRRLDHDQRRLRVSLTPRSRALSRRMAPQIEATYRNIESLIGAEFSAAFYRALDELIGALSVGPGRIENLAGRQRRVYNRRTAREPRP
jgi:homoprotocatechuate degradation regulator HpaR